MRYIQHYFHYEHPAIEEVDQAAINSVYSALDSARHSLETFASRIDPEAIERFNIHHVREQLKSARKTISKANRYHIKAGTSGKATRRRKAEREAQRLLKEAMQVVDIGFETAFCAEHERERAAVEARIQKIQEGRKAYFEAIRARRNARRKARRKARAVRQHTKAVRKARIHRPSAPKSQDQVARRKARARKHVVSRPVARARKAIRFRFVRNLVRSAKDSVRVLQATVLVANDAVDLAEANTRGRPSASTSWLTGAESQEGEEATRIAIQEAHDRVNRIEANLERTKRSAYRAWLDELALNPNEAAICGARDEEGAIPSTQEIPDHQVRYDGATRRPEEVMSCMTQPIVPRVCIGTNPHALGKQPLMGMRPDNDPNFWNYVPNWESTEEDPFAPEKDLTLSALETQKNLEFLAQSAPKNPTGPKERPKPFAEFGCPPDKAVVVNARRFEGQVFLEDLVGENFQSCSFTNCTFQGVSLKGTNFRRAEFKNVHFDHVDASEADFCFAKFLDSKESDSLFQGANFFEARANYGQAIYWLHSEDNPRNQLPRGMMAGFTDKKGRILKGYQPYLPPSEEAKQLYRLEEIVTGNDTAPGSWKSLENEEAEVQKMVPSSCWLFEGINSEEDFLQETMHKQPILVESSFQGQEELLPLWSPQQVNSAYDLVHSSGRMIRDGMVNAKSFDAVHSIVRTNRAYQDELRSARSILGTTPKGDIQKLEAKYESPILFRMDGKHSEARPVADFFTTRLFPRSHTLCYEGKVEGEFHSGLTFTYWNGTGEKYGGSGHGQKRRRRSGDCWKYARREDGSYFKYNFSKELKKERLRATRAKNDIVTPDEATNLRWPLRNTHKIFATLDENPRKKNTKGWVVYSLILGYPEGISYEKLKAAYASIRTDPKDTVSHHLQWDLNYNRLRIEDAEGNPVQGKEKGKRKETAKKPRKLISRNDLEAMDIQGGWFVPFKTNFWNVCIRMHDGEDWEIKPMLTFKNGGGFCENDARRAATMAWKAAKSNGTPIQIVLRCSNKVINAVESEGAGGLPDLGPEVSVFKEERDLSDRGQEVSYEEALIRKEVGEVQRLTSRVYRREVEGFMETDWEIFNHGGVDKEARNILRGAVHEAIVERNKHYETSIRDYYAGEISKDVLEEPVSKAPKAKKRKTNIWEVFVEEEFIGYFYENVLWKLKDSLWEGRTYGTWKEIKADLEKYPLHFIDAEQRAEHNQKRAEEHERQVEQAGIVWDRLRKEASEKHRKRVAEEAAVDSERKKRKEAREAKAAAKREAKQEQERTDPMAEFLERHNNPKPSLSKIPKTSRKDPLDMLRDSIKQGCFR